MRRIRGEPGGHVLIPATRRATRGTITIEAAEEFSVDADIRKLLDEIRAEVGDRLLANGRSIPDLAARWELGTTSGGPTSATASVETTSRSGSAYLGRVADAILDSTIPRVITRWLDAAAPRSGDGVSTPATPKTAGGRIPSTTR